ncbi:hypothetical protein [Kingella negevensis]|nr:hypothetical protein [Kingella negevensis]MDK4688469.1 hypothetical protein [Kingella negevensis]
MQKLPVCKIGINFGDLDCIGDFRLREYSLMERRRLADTFLNS